jgi:mRNA interferase MazF
MKRGEIWWINFDPSLGSEIQKKRPAVIVSNNAANLYLSRVTVIPLTTNISRVYPSEVLINLDGSSCKAMANQLMTIDKLRALSKISKASKEDMTLIEEVIKVHLGLSM